MKDRLNAEALISSMAFDDSGETDWMYVGDTSFKWQMDGITSKVGDCLYDAQLNVNVIM